MKRLCLFVSLFMLLIALRDGRLIKWSGCPVLTFEIAELEKQPVLVMVITTENGERYAIDLSYVGAIQFVPDSRVM